MISGYPMLTVWCIVISFGSLFFIGMPIALLLSRAGDDDSTHWILAPFVGLSVIILTLQNLAYLDVRIGLSAPWLWAAACLLWVWVIKKGRFIPLISAFPLRPLLSAFSVYLIQGMGLILVGASYYVGRAWHDQFNYTAIAQFLVDYPFSFSVNDISNQPFLFQAVSRKLDRIGQSIFHGFLSASTFTDAKTTFEIAILIAPPLITLAVYRLASQLMRSGTLALLAATAAGILPGIAMVHLESFFSQALVIPFLILWPYIISEAMKKAGAREILGASLILAAATSVYTEFYIIFVGIGFLVALSDIPFHHKKGGGNLIYLMVIVATALLLNLWNVKSIVNIFERISIPGMFEGIYPYAKSVEGLRRAWFGDIGAALKSPFKDLGNVISLGLVVIAYCGLGISFWKRKEGFTLALLALALAPLAGMLKGGYKYQTYKLLLSISPLLPLGIALLIEHGKQIDFSVRPAFKKTVHAIIVILFISSSIGTLSMTVRSGIGKTQEKIGRGGAFKLLSPGTKSVQDKLATLHGQDVYILWKDDFFNGNFINGWLTYFARHNRVHIFNTLVGDANLESYIPPLKDFAEGAFILTPYPAQNAVGRSIRDVWTAEPYRLWKLSGADWVVMCDLENPNGLESAGGQQFFWVGGNDTVIKLIAGREGELIMNADFYPGPSLPESDTRNILIKTDKGYEKSLKIGVNYRFPIAVPISRGQNQITIYALDKPSLTTLPNGDARPLLLQIRGLHLQAFK